MSIRRPMPWCCRLMRNHRSRRSTATLGDPDRKIGDFAARGVGGITVSGDDRERAAKSKAEWEIENVTIGYAQSIRARPLDARVGSLRLHRHQGGYLAEPAEFGEPGVFLIRPDQEVYYIATSSAPCARPSPSFRELLGAIDYALEVDLDRTTPRGALLLTDMVALPKEVGNERATARTSGVRTRTSRWARPTSTARRGGRDLRAPPGPNTRAPQGSWQEPRDIGRDRARSQRATTRGSRS